jgi:hypothetical protein
MKVMATDEKTEDFYGGGACRKHWYYMAR